MFQIHQNICPIQICINSTKFAKLFPHHNGKSPKYPPTKLSDYGVPRPINGYACFGESGCSFKVQPLSWDTSQCTFSCLPTKRYTWQIYPLDECGDYIYCLCVLPTYRFRHKPKTIILKKIIFFCK